MNLSPVFANWAADVFGALAGGLFVWGLIMLSQGDTSNGVKLIGSGITCFLIGMAGYGVYL